MLSNRSKFVGRDPVPEEAHPATFPAELRSTQDTGWITSPPNHEFHKFLQQPQAYPTYLEADIGDGSLMVSEGVTRIIPSKIAVPNPPLKSFSHARIPDSDLCEACEGVDIRQLLGHGNGRKYQLGWADQIIACNHCALCRIITASLQCETSRGYSLDFAEFEEQFGNDTNENMLKLPNQCFVILTSHPSSDPPSNSSEENRMKVLQFEQAGSARGSAQYQRYAQAIARLRSKSHTKTYRQYQLYCSFLHTDTRNLLGQATIRLLDEDTSKLKKPTRFSGRQTDIVRADMKLARSWLVECDHSHDCLSRGKKAPIDNLAVIDVRQNCLVELPRDAVYLALSYTWPWLDTTRLVRENIEHLRKPGALLDAENRIPNVIRDALQVVRDLDETYIWIDALCIVQDDDDLKMKLISRMDEVYEGAYLTIVAASSTDPKIDYPIPGMGGPRHHHQTVETIEGLRLVSAYPDYNQSLERSKWATRGWTYQEGLLSKRCLIFTDHQMYFRCTRDARCEDVVAEWQIDGFEEHPARPEQRKSKVDYLLNAKFLQNTRNKNWFGEYARIVCDYSKRNLGQESDINNAFSGILHKLSPYIEGSSFMSGHPFAKFDQSLRWYPTSKSERRVATVTPKHAYSFPTWSWMGWKGGVDYEYEQPGATPGIVNQWRCVQWYRWSEYGLVPVRDKWHLYRPPYSDSAEAFELALLWGRAHEMRKNAACILSWGTIARMKLRLPETFIAEWVTDWDQTVPCFIIEDQDGNACGLLPSVDRTWSGKYKEGGGGECELLQLSITHRARDNLRAGGRMLHKKYAATGISPELFMDVMLVEHTDEGLTYRRGIGLVHVSALNFSDLLKTERRIVMLA